jgi:hypothetical protein
MGTRLGLLPVPVCDGANGSGMGAVSVGEKVGSLCMGISLKINDLALSSSRSRVLNLRLREDDEVPDL